MYIQTLYNDYSLLYMIYYLALAGYVTVRYARLRFLHKIIVSRMMDDRGNKGEETYCPGSLLTDVGFTFQSGLS